MKRVMMGAITAGILLSSVSLAEASLTWDFTFAGSGQSGSGEFTTGDTGSPYTITGISGIANGLAITGLSGWDGGDTNLYYPGPAYVDYGGVSFSTGSGATEIDYNLWTNYPTAPPTYYSDTTLNGANLPITLTVTPTPEPSSLIVWGLGAVGLLAVARRRRRSA